MKRKAVVMAGGQGKRFWPLSREIKPKQFLSIAGDKSLLQKTVERIETIFEAEDVFVVCAEPYIELVREQVPQLSDNQLMVEPAPRNTAACIGLAAVHFEVGEDGEDTSMLVLPADHSIQDLKAFEKVVGAGFELSEEGWLVTLGMEPTYAATGYGYIERGEALKERTSKQAYIVKQFVEKPDQGRAEQFLSAGNYFWNSGMFVWSVPSISRAIRNHMPELAAVLEVMRSNWADPSQWEPLFSQLSSVSIDYGVMERAEKVAVIPAQLGWDDVGSWKSIWKLLCSEGSSLAPKGEILALDSENCLVLSKGNKLTALLGVNNLAVVETQDALLVCNLDRSEEVKRVVEKLQESGRKDLV